MGKDSDDADTYFDGVKWSEVFDDSFSIDDESVYDRIKYDMKKTINQYYNQEEIERLIREDPEINALKKDIEDNIKVISEPKFNDAPIQVVCDHQWMDYQGLHTCETICRKCGHPKT